jgi:asparagine synthetase B (glutamine-hydrolysing)
MCGIAGLLLLESSPSPPSILTTINAVFHHRGRDNEGCLLIDQVRGSWKSFSGKDSHDVIRELRPLMPRDAADAPAKIGLAHRRVSIQDLSADKHLSFFVSDVSWSAVFNGKIYNNLPLFFRSVVLSDRIMGNSQAS